ncbi:hypothetical protein WDZ92_29080, partial [Nostoc sp. NIES-2111]
FRGARFPSSARLPAGEAAAQSGGRAALDRYATSKLVLMTNTVELARRYPSIRFMNFDPGLMPGTGLVRTAPWPVRMGWNSILRWAVPLMPGASTPERSAAVARRLIADSAFESGMTYGTSARPESVWEKVNDPNFGRDVLDQSLAFLRTVNGRSPALPAL